MRSSSARDTCPMLGIIRCSKSTREIRAGSPVPQSESTTPPWSCRFRADSRYVRLPVSPAQPPTIWAGRFSSLRQVVGDVARPGVDLGPVAEVALREHRTGSWQLPDRPFRKPELVRVQGSEEDTMALGPDGTLELGHLLGFGGDGQVCLLYTSDAADEEDSVD